MEVALEKRLFTRHDYFLMGKHGILTSEDRVELLNGEIVQMSPIGSFHAYAVDEIISLFYQYFSKKATIRSQGPIILGDFSAPEPDICMLRNGSKKYKEKTPEAGDVLLLVEVAMSTYDKDKYVKLPLYAKAGIPQFWLVNLQKAEIEVYRNPQEDTYTNLEIIKGKMPILVDAFKQEIAVSQIFE